MKELESVGGLWSIPEEVDEQLDCLSKPAQKRKALEVQLKFRKFVLEGNNKHKILNLSAGGKKLSIQQMMSNLKAAIRESQDEHHQVILPGPNNSQLEPVLLTPDQLAAEKAKVQELIEGERQKVNTNK